MPLPLKTIAVGLAIALAPAAANAESAVAMLKNNDGKALGEVTLTETASGMIHIVANLEGLPPGVHGFHVHAKGDCSASDFTSAAGHLASGREHGVLADGGPHPGDLPNIHVGDDGKLMVEYFNGLLTFDSSGEGAMFDEDGSAVMIHAGADDYQSQPSGAAGARIGCGVLEKQ